LNSKDTAAWALVVILLALISIVPNVKAQSTSITSLQAPSTAAVGTQVTVTVGATYDLGSSGYAVGIGIFDLDAWWATGSAQSSRYTCHSNPPGQAFCGYIPTARSGSDAVTFELTLNTVKTYRLRASVELFHSNAQLISGASTFQDFSIVVSATPSQNSGAVSGTVSISNFQYPTTVLLGEQAIVSFTVSFSGFTPGVTYLVVGVPNADGSNWASGSVVSSSPDNCPEGTEQDRGLAVCFYQPVESQGSEKLVFSLTVNSAGTFSSHGAEAEPALRSSSCSSNWCFGQSQYTSSFAIQAVTSLPPSLTTSTTGVSASDAAMYFEMLMCGLVIIVVGVIAYQLYGSKRRKETVQTKLDSIMVQTQQQPPVQQQPLPIQTPREIVSSKDMMSCKQCGARITRDSKFCKECGATQR
jgi:hypothetical protein